MIIKNLLKYFFGFTGYVWITKKHFDNLKGGPWIHNLDFYYHLKMVFKSKEPICCFDIGANEGQTSKKLIEYFTRSTIYSFEPIKETYNRLVTNTKSFPSVKVFNIAMGETPGEITVYHRTNSEWNSLVKELNEDARVDGAISEIVKVDTLDNFIKKRGIEKIDILKSDTEGFELSVLKGAVISLTAQIIDILYIEVGFRREDIQHTYYMDVVNFLDQYEYYFCGFFESSYGEDLRVYYANALFMSSKKLIDNKTIGKI